MVVEIVEEKCLSVYIITTNLSNMFDKIFNSPMTRSCWRYGRFEIEIVKVKKRLMFISSDEL